MVELHQLSLSLIYLMSKELFVPWTCLESSCLQVLKHPTFDLFDLLIYLSFPLTKNLASILLKLYCLALPDL